MTGCHFDDMTYLSIGVKEIKRHCKSFYELDDIPHLHQPDECKHEHVQYEMHWLVFTYLKDSSKGMSM